jgi:Glycosyl hydrolase family 76
MRRIGRWQLVLVVGVLVVVLARGVVAAGATVGRGSARGSARGAVAAKAQPRATSRAKARPRKPSRAQALAAQYAQQAIVSYAAMQRAYYVASVGLYRGAPYADAWPYSQAMAATISVAALPGMHTRYRPDLVARLSELQAYADHTDPAPAGYLAVVAPPLGHATSARFNDDNEWIGIELLRLYNINHQPALLSAAAQLMTMAYSQWDSTPGDPCPGGVPWQTLTTASDRNTVSNAPGAELGAQLYLTTGQATYLQSAQQMYAWTRGCLLNPDGLYGDHISPDGQIDPTEWTYNQGTMIGAGVMLYDATHNRAYLRQAQTTAQAALATFDPQQLADQPVSFNAIYVRNLLLLAAATNDPRYERFARWFADDAWFNVRDPTSGLFLADPGGTTQLIDQASMVQVYALLGEPPNAYF